MVVSGLFLKLMHMKHRKHNVSPRRRSSFSRYYRRSLSHQLFSRPRELPWRLGDSDTTPNRESLPQCKLPSIALPASPSARLGSKLPPGSARAEKLSAGRCLAPEARQRRLGDVPPGLVPGSESLVRGPWCSSENCKEP